MKVAAAIATAPKAPFELVELELDEPRPGEVQVRLTACGVCHTDAIVRDQWYPTPLPAVLGHEGAGVVESVGAGVTDLAPGDKVVLSFNSCGACRPCLSGHPAYCENFYAHNFAGRRPDGGTAFTQDGGEPVSSHFFGQSAFAAVSNVARRSVVKVDDDAPLELLGPLGCGIQTGAGAVLNVLDPEAGSNIVVFGAGAVGLSAVMAAVVAHATTIVAVDVVPSRLELARELGATHTVDGRAADQVEQIRRITGGGAQYALDTTGVAPVFRTMTDCMGIRGRAALVGASALGTESTIDIGTQLLSGQTISMVIEGDSNPQLFIPRLIHLYRAGLFPFDKLVRTYPLADINQALEDSENGDTLKPVVLF
ncbi:aryl-alcohol dehydrogenase [Kocuria dechangensis]|uniref:Aryl-alcohol dehydrogenase n=1 Tax=Kocuria dechangensis TaxID=1176249 RepID=A0A917H3X8_9MICC|nr:NAD(P)-dependent alcohol dehydrogenase [Kocuria dechangensis]GGG66815.1 aryl-alcohol dehydrogenase [Kocuria dechangensis]